jgi:hypothetical protein
MALLFPTLLKILASEPEARENNPGPPEKFALEKPICGTRSPTTAAGAAMPTFSLHAHHQRESCLTGTEAQANASRDCNNNTGELFLVPNTKRNSEEWRATLNPKPWSSALLETAQVEV